MTMQGQWCWLLIGAVLNAIVGAAASADEVRSAKQVRAEFDR
jgi:hypothetical protein